MLIALQRNTKDKNNGLTLVLQCLSNHWQTLSKFQKTLIIYKCI